MTAPAGPGRSWPRRRRVDYFWMVMGRCNYRCPYCVYGLVSEDRRKIGHHHSAERWLAAWKRMHDRYGEGNILLTGGEPTLYPGFGEVVLQLSRWFGMAFDTNLSWDKESLGAFLAAADPGRVRFEISFHPTSTEAAPFIEKALMVKEAGFGYINRLVAYPTLLPRVAEFRELFERNGLAFVVNPFRGEHEGRTYPEAYSGPERQLISRATVGIEENPSNAPHKEFVRQMLALESPLGRLCRSGYQHLRIEDDGAVHRCCEYAGRGWEPFGNFLADDFELWDEPRECRSDRCEWEYRWLVDQAERFQNASLSGRREGPDG